MSNSTTYRSTFVDFSKFAMFAVVILSLTSAAFSQTQTKNFQSAPLSDILNSDGSAKKLVVVK